MRLTLAGALVTMARAVQHQRGVMDSRAYLHHIGITAWRWRERAPSPEPLSVSDVHVYSLRASDGVVGLLIADAGAALADEKVLVEAIGAATQRLVAGGHHINWCCAWTDLPPVVIALGERVSTELCALSDDGAVRFGQLQPLPQGGQVICSYAPAALLEDRGRKAQTWQAVQLAMQVMA